MSRSRPVEVALAVVAALGLTACGPADHGSEQAGGECVARVQLGDRVYEPVRRPVPSTTTAERPRLGTGTAIGCDGSPIPEWAVVFHAIEGVDPSRTVRVVAVDPSSDLDGVYELDRERVSPGGVGLPRFGRLVGGRLYNRTHEHDPP